MTFHIGDCPVVVRVPVSEWISRCKRNLSIFIPILPSIVCRSVPHLVYHHHLLVMFIHFLTTAQQTLFISFIFSSIPSSPQTPTTTPHHPSPTSRSPEHFEFESHISSFEVPGERLSHSPAGPAEMKGTGDEQLSCDGWL